MLLKRMQNLAYIMLLCIRHHRYAQLASIIHYTALLVCILHFHQGISRELLENLLSACSLTAAAVAIKQPQIHDLLLFSRFKSLLRGNKNFRKLWYTKQPRTVVADRSRTPVQKFINAIAANNLWKIRAVN